MPMRPFNFQLSLLTVMVCSAGILVNGQTMDFDLEEDLLLVQYDFKTDVDDLHSVAAFATLITDPKYAKIKYHAVAGAYGIQEGRYVPPEQLMNRVFGDRWSNAHKDFDNALKEVATRVSKTLINEGDIWIAEGGQSDFSAALVKAIQAEMPKLNTADRVHIVQHAAWNEEVTAAEHLAFVREHTHYQKIPDGNATGNGTPGFRSDQIIPLDDYISDIELLKTWQLAIEIANRYNGKEERYLNESIEAGGLDFSDFSEVCWILGLQEIKDAKHFFSIIFNGQ